MYNIGKIKKISGISRSTLLYYDRIKLISPVERSRSNYRCYSQEDVKRLEKVMLYRQAGLSLKTIKSVLDSSNRSSLTAALEQKLGDLNNEIMRLRDKQRFITSILKNDSHKHIKVMNKDTWISLLSASGFSKEDMLKWHADFERLSPEKHKEFLSFLCIPEDDIIQIKEEAQVNQENI